MKEELLIKALDLNNSANKVEFSSSEKGVIRENIAYILEELDSRVKEKTKDLEKKLRPHKALQDGMQDNISKLEADVSSILGIIAELKESYDNGLSEFYENGSLSEKSARKLDDLIQKLESVIVHVYGDDGLAKVAEQRSREFWQDKDGKPEQQTETQVYKSSAEFDYSSKLKGLKDAVSILKTVDMADLVEQILGAKLLKAFVEDGGEYDDEEAKIQELLKGLAGVSGEQKLEIEEKLGVYDAKIKRDHVIGLEEIFSEKVDDVERFVVVEAEKISGVERSALDKLMQITDTLRRESRGLELLYQSIQSFCEEVNALADKNFNYREIQQILANIKVIQNDLEQVDYIDTRDLSVMVNKIAAKIENTPSLFAEKTITLRLYDLSGEERNSLLDLLLTSVFPRLEELDFSHNNDISIEEWTDILDKVSKYSDLRIKFYNTILSKKLREQGVDFEFGQTFTVGEVLTKLETWNVNIMKVRDVPKDGVQYLGITGLESIDFGDNTILKSLFSGFNNLKQLNFSNTEIYNTDMLESILDPLKNDVLIKVSASDKEDLGLEKEEFTKAEYYQYKAKIQDQIQEEAQNQAATQIQKMIRGFQARKEAERLKNERMESSKKKGGINTDKIERVDSLRHEPEILSTQVGTDYEAFSPKSNISHRASLADELEGMDVDKPFSGINLADELREEGVHLDQYFQIENITPSEMDLVESRATIEDVNIETGEIVTTKVKGLPKDKFESRLDIDFDGDIQEVLRKLACQLNVQLDLNQSYVFPPTIIFGSDLPILDMSTSSELVVKDKGQLMAKQALDKSVAEFFTQSVNKNNGIILPIRMGGQYITEAVILNRNAKGDYFITYIGDLKSPICELIYKITTSLKKSNVNIVVKYFDVNLMKNGHSKQTTVFAGISQAIRGMAIGKALEDTVQEHDMNSLSLILPQKDRGFATKLSPAESVLISTHKIDKPKPSVRDMSVQTEPYMQEIIQKKKVKHGEFTPLVAKTSASDSPIKDKGKEVIKSIYERISFNHAQEYMRAHHYLKEHEASLELYKQSASYRLPAHINEHLKRVKIYEDHYILEVRKPNPKNVKDNIYKDERKKILKEVIGEITEKQLEALTIKKGYREYDIGQDGQQLILIYRFDENGKISFNLEEIIQAKGTCSIAVPRLCPDGKQAHDIIEVVNGELRTFVMSEVGESKIKEEQMDFLLDNIIRQQSQRHKSSDLVLSH